MNSTKLRWELLVGAFLVNLRLLETREVRSKNCSLPAPLHSLCSSQRLLCSLPTPWEAVRDTWARLTPNKGQRSLSAPACVIQEDHVDSYQAGGLTQPFTMKDHRIIGSGVTSDGHLAHILQGKEGKPQE